MRGIASHIALDLLNKSLEAVSTALVAARRTKIQQDLEDTQIEITKEILKLIK